MGYDPYHSRASGRDVVTTRVAPALVLSLGFPTWRPAPEKKAKGALYIFFYYALTLLLA